MMDMRQCAQGGHYYDASIHNECPYCSNPSIGVTMPLDTTRAVPPTAAAGQPRPEQGERVTKAIIEEDMGIDPVVGWLVNMSGDEKGRDYRIHTDNNYVGSDKSMDISIGGDNTISGINHAVISYDERDRLFYFAPVGGRSIVRLNDRPVLGTVEIHAYDILEIGKTKLIFMPLCGEKFEWRDHV